MSSRPVSSPAAPAAGCRVAAAIPVISHRASSSSTSSPSQPWVSDAGAAGWTPARPGQSGHGVTDLGVVLHGARPERVGPEVDRELPVGQSGEVGHQVALGHLGQGNRLTAEVSLGNELLERNLGDPRGAERPARLARSGELEERGLGRLTQERRAVGSAPGGPAAIGCP